MAVLIVLGAGAALVGGRKFHSARQMRTSHVAVARQQQELRDRITELRAEQRITEESAVAIEADNTLLAVEVKKARVAEIAAAAKSAAVSSEVAKQRIKAARHLGEGHDPEKALAELLWCWDEGVKLAGRAGQVAHRSVIGDALAKLMERYPPAEAAIRERWIDARARYLQVGDVDGTLASFTALSRLLKEKEAIVALYDQLATEDHRRGELARSAFGELLEARRYNDALVGRSFMLMMIQARELQADPSAQPRLYQYGVKTAAANVEVLAGAGELANARELIGRILQYHSTPATRELLRSHLQRAGHPQLLDD